jgi:NAD(P)-dependent dehydrogenase (short-subunit alcohol dehydrogenase family)
MSSVWLITGCSSGIGRELGRAALERGHSVVLTARDAGRLREFAEAHPDRALALELDVTRAEQVSRAVAEALRRFARIDVLVNNAGYGYLAAIEEGEDAEVRAMFETNFFGAVAMIKAVLPGMRARRSGRVINVSSMAGLLANPGTGYYSASKWALEATSEALARELAPFGIRVTAVEPGAFRTDWAGRSMRQTRTPIADYDATVGARRAFIRSVDGKQPGDPRRAADAILRIAEHPDPPMHLLLGNDVLDGFRARLSELSRSISEWEDVTRDVEFREP